MVSPPRHNGPEKHTAKRVPSLPLGKLGEEHRAQNGERTSAPNNFMACMPFVRDETTTAGTHVCWLRYRGTQSDEWASRGLQL